MAYAQTSEEAVQTGSVIKFVDKDFPANNTSLYNEKVKADKLFLLTLALKNFNKTKWIRPQNLRVKKKDGQAPKLCLYRNPVPSDVVQGSLGSCWYLSALSSLVNHPESFKRVIHTSSYNEYGMYQFQLCIRGKWKVITVDDLLPTNMIKIMLAAKIKNGQLFAALLEKAVAKEHGSYNAIIRGSCAEGLQTLTGHPCDVFILSETKTLQEKEDFWNKLLNAINLDYVMTCLCSPEKKKLKTIATGLHNKHIYSILDILQFNHNGENVKLLKLRNPWGKSEWRGDWSNKWTKWPIEIKRQLLVNPEKNGIFWISFEDVLNNFYDISMCKVRSDWTCSRFSGIFRDYSNQIECYKINLNDPSGQQVEIELFSDGRALEFFDRTADPMIDLALIICRIGTTGLEGVAYKHRIEQAGDFVRADAFLTPGEYIVFATSIKAILIMDREKRNESVKSGNFFKFNIAFHSTTPLEISSAFYAPEMVSDIFLASRTSHLKNVCYELDNDVRFSMIYLGVVYALAVENLSDTKCVKIKIDNTPNVNIDRTRLTEKTTDHLCPRQSKWVFFCVPLNFRKGHNFKHYKVVEYDDSGECSGIGNHASRSDSFYGLYATNESCKIYEQETLV